MTTKVKGLTKTGLSVIKTEMPQKEKGSPDSCLTELGTWETSDFKQSVGMLFRCREEHAMGLLIGPPGSGKTTIINSFCQRFSHTIVITAKVTMAIKDLLEAIARSVNLTVYGSNDNRFELIVEALRHCPITLIIDETENLITRSSISKIEILRQLHDMTGIGVILCGTSRLEELIIRGPNGRENLAQLYSRIIYRFRLSGLKNKEVTEILNSYSIDKNAGDELRAIAMSVNRGGIRMFSNVLRRCLSIAPVVTKDVLDQAVGMMVIK